MNEVLIKSKNYDFLIAILNRFMLNSVIFSSIKEGNNNENRPKSF